ncbi:DUF1361 domain-containing protein [Sabulilitoribacter arenilitoris]|uniref:DUF1361 domain-containing protein n=2 Tax=Wocania arenilitoris TaxID=2044858 RepID=A0AAE3JLP5_9FLAO|nr:DUF1361 domain-containing protein [Wocania arenilitoris]
MDNIKKFIFKRFKIFSIITVSVVLSLTLLMFRMKISHSFFYIFLVWNLFLAAVPYTISTYLLSNPKFNKVGLAFGFGLWLLFLPNAPYIVTDLIHLKLSNSYFIWIDILIVSSFAFNGLLLFYLSVLDMKTILEKHIKKVIVKRSIIPILLLSGFGVYLGRFLRYNSWEILSNPKYLITDIFNIITQPIAHKEAWLFTLLFGAFLNVGFWMFKQFYSKPST